MTKITFQGTCEEFGSLLEQNKICNNNYEMKSNGFYCFTTPDGIKINLFSTGTVQVQGKEPYKKEIESKLSSIVANSLNNTGLLSKGKKQIFVVHGHDVASREQLELILHKLQLPEHFILQNSSGNGLTIIEALENNIGKNPDSCFGIVLLTPDDMGYAKNDGVEKQEPRARQNVVLEMGMLLSSLGRERVAILKKGIWKYRPISMEFYT